MIVLVGRDLGEPERFRRVVRNALMAAFGMMGLGALAIWFFVGRRALKRIDDVSEASLRIMGGDLSGRLPVTGAGDEFDRLSENLNAMLARIAELNEGLKQVSDNIAHDLKTPLTRLRNRAEATLRATARTDGYRAALQGTIAESDQLIRTFNAILMISRLEAGYSAEAVGHRRPRPAPCATSSSSTSRRPRRSAWSSNPTRRAAFVATGNRELIGQALSNIVDNAIKYSARIAERGGQAVRAGRAVAGIRRNPLAVSDNGPGIPDEADRQRATERFVRLEQSRSQPGSGLGLSLAKAVMKFHGGRLELAAGDPGLIVSMVFPEKTGCDGKSGGSKRKKAPAWSWTPQSRLCRSTATRPSATSRISPRQPPRRGLPRLAALLAQAGPVRDFLAAAFDLSDFLRDCARRRPEALDQLFDVTIADRLAAINAEIAAAPFAEGVSETTLMAALRTLEAGGAFADRARRSRRRERRRRRRCAG